MSELVSQFYDLFNLNTFLNSESMTLLDFLKGYITLFVACIFVIITFRFIMEFIKIFMDWTRFK